MEKTLQIVSDACADGLFSSYAIGGGIAALFYIEPVTTFDLDIFIILPESSSSIISLSPLYRWLERRGYKALKEQVVIEGVAVQFIPAYNDLVKEGVINAVMTTYGKTKTFVLRAEYLVATMLQAFRPKDKDRLIKFMEETRLDNVVLDSILLKYNLNIAFKKFKEQYYGG